MMSIPLFHSFDMNTTLVPILESIDDEILSTIQGCLNDDPKQIDDIITITSHNTAYVWILSIICSAIIGLSGLLPVLLTPETYGNKSTSAQSNAVALGMPVGKQWDTDYKEKILKTYDRITLATGLYTRPPWASETLRVSSYGVAGKELRQ